MRPQTLSLILSTLVVFIGSFSGAEIKNLTSKQYNYTQFYTGSFALEKVRLSDVNWKESEPDAIGDFQEPQFIPAGRKVELKVAEMTNQCRTSECYLFSTINYINTYNVNQRPQTAVTISEPFLVAHKFLQYINENVWYGPNSERVVHNLKGGFVYEAVQLTRKVGLIPKDDRIWTPAVPYADWKMPEIYEKLNSSVLAWNAHINSTAQRYGWDSEQTRSSAREAYETISNIILAVSGPLPTQFEYNGALWTPKSFEDQLGIPKKRALFIDNKEGYSIPSNAKDVLNEGMHAPGGWWQFRAGDYESIINNSVKFINEGHPVIMDFSWKGDGHSMLIVGYNVDNQGYVTHLKVMNSWGKNYANDGYVWYTLPDVWANVMRVYKFGAIPQQQ